MVKIAGFWKRVKNGMKKFGDGKLGKAVKNVARVGSNILNTVGTIANIAAPFTAAIPGVGTAVRAAQAIGNIGGAVTGLIANGLGSERGDRPVFDAMNGGTNKVEAFDYQANNFHKSNVGPPGQGQSLADDGYTNSRTFRGISRPRYYYNSD